MRVFAEDSNLKIGGEREFVLSMNRIFANYFVNSFHWVKGSQFEFLLVLPAYSY